MQGKGQKPTRDFSTEGIETHKYFVFQDVKCIRKEISFSNKPTTKRGDFYASEQWVARSENEGADECVALFGLY